MDTPKMAGIEIAALSNMIKRLRPSPWDLEDAEITNMQRWFVGYLRSRGNDDVFQGDLEDTFNITRATASSILKRMEKNDLVIRLPVSHDARLKKIVLTERAIRISDAVRDHIDKIESLIIEGIPADELEIFFKVIHTMKDNLEKCPYNVPSDTEERRLARARRRAHGCGFGSRFD